MLAVWCHVRWPGAAPASLGGAVVRAVLAVGLLHVGLVVLEAAVGSSGELALAAMLGIVLPALTFAFLASLWVLRLFANAFRGLR